MKINLKTLFLSSLLIAVSFNSNANQTGQYRISACHGCDTPNTNLSARKVYAVTENGISYVIDKPNNSFRKFTIYTEWINTGDRNVPVRRSIEKTLTSTETEAGIELLAAIEELYSGKQYRKSNRSSLVADIEVIEDPNGKDAYDFVTTSIMRNQLYGLHMATKVSTFANTVNLITAKVSLGAINLKDIKLSLKLIFPNGSYVTVIPNPVTETYDLAPNGSRDSDGNTIPLIKSNARGRYIFSSQFGLENFNNYIGLWGSEVRFIWDNSCRSVTVTCRDSGSGALVCTGSCN